MEPAETSSSDTSTLRLADQACSECRRRKSKCNRLLPVCGQCRRLKKRCVYEKHVKTPLTRRHLTEVEAELARMRSLLNSVLPEEAAKLLDSPGASAREDRSASRTGGERGVEDSSQLASPQFMLDGAVDANQTIHLADTSHHLEVGYGDGGGVINSGYLGGTEMTQPGQQQNGYVSSAKTPTTTQYQGTNSNSYGNGNFGHTPGSGFGSVRSAKTTMMSLESPPAAGDFEWDERTNKPEGDKFVDGMANLTSESNEGGYLGVASGAALLRLTETRPTDPRTDTHWPETAGSVPRSLPPPAHLDGYVDAYFRLYHVSYPIVHEPTFRAQYMEVIPRPSHNAWHVLLYVIAALGAFTTRTHHSETVDLALFQAAKSRLSIDMLETGNIVLVQVMTLISNYLQKRNKPNSGYNYTGLARRTAMGIGLHKEFPNWEALPLKLEIRRRAWWCLFIFDVGAVVTFSRPLDLPEGSGGVEVQLPLNAHDSDLTAATRTEPAPAQETTIYTHVRAQSAFHLATNEIYSRIISTPYPTANELISLDDNLIGNWLASLPPFFQESTPQQAKFILCHSILRWRYRNLRILMYRPFVIRRVVLKAKDGQVLDQPEQEDVSATDVAIQRCLSAAAESVDLISSFWATESKSMMACWYGLYFLFQAIMIPVVCLRNDPQSMMAMAWRDQVLRAIQVMEDMSSLNEAAERCVGVIRSLCGAYLTPLDDGWNGPTQESPQTQLSSLYPLLWPTLESAQFDGDSIIQDSTIMEFLNQMPGN